MVSKPRALTQKQLKSTVTCVSGIGAVVKVVDSHHCGWGSFPGKSCSFFIVPLSKGLSLCFMCSDQHVKYQMPHWFPLPSSLLLEYYVKKYICAYMHTSSHACMHIWTCAHIHTHTCLHAHMHTCIHAYIHTILSKFNKHRNQLSESEVSFSY